LSRSGDGPHHEQNAMDTTVYVSLSHQLALRRQMDLIANNLANANTNGFRRENAVFESFLDIQSHTSGPGRAVSYVLDHGVARDISQGDFKTTGSPLDVSIVGDGYFSVEMASGAPAYTRNGHFEIDGNGFLISANGAKVLDDGNKTVRFDASDQAIKIDGDGTVSSSSGIKARLGLVKFARDEELERLGDTLYAGSNPEKISVDLTRLKAGTLESSNVQSIVETTEMIDVLRTYQSTTRLMERYEDMRKRGLERLGRVN
jgi:flagellar basal-body rod protein FlgF